ncbi:MAG: hypothetical protein GY774_36420 [Planctomycetes bacterium]|nr:hypothetical protein [Planctomycetota bacterium]
MRLLTMSLLFLLSLGCHIAHCSEEPDNPIIIRLKDTDIAKRYVKMLDRDIGGALKSFDSQRGLLKVHIPDDGVISDAAIERLSITEKKKIADEPKYIWSCGQSRKTAVLASALAYAYSTKHSRYYQSSVIITYIKRIFSAFADHQAESGEFVFSPIHYCTVYGTHEMAWRLEPLICAFELVKSEFSTDEQNSYRLVLDRAMEFLYTHENSSLSNRGIVWCGVMTLCYRFTGEKKYLDAANRVFYWVGRLFKSDGEIREGTGPDIGYSTVSLQYLFLYRIMSGNKSLDPVLIRSLNWYRRLFTSRAIPLEGMTTRQWHTNGSIVSNVMGPLMFYAERDWSFAQTAMQYLEALEKLPGGFTLSHGGAHFLRGAQYGDISHIPDHIQYKPYAELYTSDHSQYFLYGNHYQTAVTLRGRKPLKGMQTWSYKGQRPLIFPTRTTQSHAMGIGFDSNMMDVPWDVSPVPYRLNMLSDNTGVLISATGRLCTAYLFAKDITVVVYHPQSGEMTVEWASKIPVCAELDRVTDDNVLFRNSDARIIFEQTAPSIKRNKDVIKFRFVSNKEYCWFAFAGPKSNAQVRPISQGLISVIIEEAGVTTKAVLNMSAETLNADSLNLRDVKQLLPYEAKLIKPFGDDEMR